MSRGRNPCLICAAITSGPRGGAVCDTCKRKVRCYDAAVAPKPDESWLALPTSWTRVGSDVDDLERALVTLYRAFPEADGEDVPHAQSPYASSFDKDRRLEQKFDDGGRYDAGGVKPRRMLASVAAAIRPLQQLIERAIDDAHKRGVREGTNLLAQLNAGELTNKAFDERVAYYERRRG